MSDAPTPTTAKKRGLLKFQNQTGRTPLSREEHEYWLDIFTKILKVGTEFEFNLPPSAVQMPMKGEKVPCQQLNKGCRTSDCSNLEECLVERHPSLCLTRSSGRFLGAAATCPATSDSDVQACKNCPSWALNCRGIECSMFSSHCAICPSFGRVGNEVPEAANIHRDAETIRDELRGILRPTEFVGEVGHAGVLEVKKDNSLLNDGGVEIPTVGRRVHWSSFYNMCKQIIDAALERGSFVNERSGQHYHILAGYLKEGDRQRRSVSELERPMPEIILANLHQLVRRYELAMFWITATGSSMEHLTRWARFRQSVYKFSSLRHRMATVQKELAAEIICMNGAPKDGKYASVAYHFCEFDQRGDVKTFHIENRIADGAMSPAVVAAWCMLWYAFVLKAVRLSQYGVMEMGDAEYVAKMNEIRPHLIEGERRDWNTDRRADTSRLAPHIPFLISNAAEMVSFMKPELYNAGPAHDILMSLAQKPCALRLIEGQGWENIESDLMRGHQNVIPTSLEGDLREIIDLASLVDLEGMEAWVREAAAYTGASLEDVTKAVQDMLRKGTCRWSDPIGAVIST